MRASRPPRGGAWSGPKIPQGKLRTFYRVDVTKTFDQEGGGIYRKTGQTVEELQGALLPISNEDLQYLPDGCSTVNSQKLYTNGAELEVNQKVQDSLDGQSYTVMTELTHGPIHGMRRYIVTRKGVASHK